MIGNKTELSEELVAAYSSTNFEVHAETRFVLKVGEFNENLKLIFSQLNQMTACFITAYNPESIEQSVFENDSAQGKLYEDLVSLDCTIFNGFGSDPDGNWEGEPSYFASGITLIDAKNLGKKYRQNAIVWCDQKCIPELVLLR